MLRLAAQIAALLALLVALPAPAASPPPALGRRGMVVSSQADATRAGVEMLDAGGNAADAAVATAFALAVTQPQSGGVGGGCFILVRSADGRVEAIDARETAPAAATRDMYLREGVPERASLLGPLAVGTPGFVAGLVQLQETHGALSLRRVMAPAIRLAEQGYAIGPYQARLLNRIAMYLEQSAYRPDPLLVSVHFPAPGERAAAGDRVVQKDLAKTLRAIAQGGAEPFYRGWIAGAIVAEMERTGGLVTRADLVGYEPVSREPVKGTYRGHEVWSFPPPSSGGVALVETLNILEGFDLAERGALSSAGVHRIAEALKLAFADRAVFLGDPDFVDVPVARLTSKEHAAALRKRINPPRWKRWPWTWGRAEVAIRVKAPGLPANDSGTTHLSTADSAGNAVALTLTINTPYGSLLMVDGTGIVLNNEMDDFAKDVNTPNVYGLVDVRGANAIAPGKRPLSSMTPTLVVKDGRPFMVTGSPGGPRIISTTLLSILNVIDYGADVKAAVSAPRFHHQWVPDTLYVEREIPEDVVEGLRERGHHVEAEDHWSSAEAITWNADLGLWEGGNDPRRDGLALGVD